MESGVHFGCLWVLFSKTLMQVGIRQYYIMGGKGSEQVEVEAPKGFGASLMHNLMTPGSSLTSTMQMIVNVIYAVLFFVICLCIYGDSSYIHFYGMMVLLIGLICTTNWYAICPCSPKKPD